MWLHMILTSGSSFPSLPVMTLQLCRVFLDLFGPSSIREGFLSSSVQIARLGGEVFGEVDSDFRRFLLLVSPDLHVSSELLVYNADVLGENFGGAGIESGTGAARW